MVSFSDNIFDNKRAITGLDQTDGMIRSMWQKKADFPDFVVLGDTREYQEENAFRLLEIV